jgi:DNA-binding SARP family transcriptional activator/serine/threonine protein kinase/WD40 repeat protein
VTDLHGITLPGSEVRGFEYRVLGQLDVRVRGTTPALGGRKQRGVLAVLIAAAGRPVSVDALLLATYGDDASPSSKATLHTYVSNLRKVLGDVILRQGDAYLLDCTEATIDAVAFEELCARAAAIEDPERAAGALREALSLWRGHAYADIEASGHLDGEITRLSEMRLAALEARIDADMRAGRHREVVGELDALTVEYPYRESLQALHMLALYRCGRQAEALRAYARTRELLVEGLGIDPSLELKDLEGRILAQDRDLLISVGPTVQRRAVLVADLDDAGWRDPFERDTAYGRRDDDLEAVAAAEGGTKLSPRGTAGYVCFGDAISAVRAARSIVNDGTRIAIDVGDLELREDEPVGPPLARAARLVAIAHAGQVLLSSAAHDALAASAQTGWAAESLGRFDIVGLDPAVHVYQLVGHGFGLDFPPLRVDRLPPPVPGGVERSVPGYELRQLIGTGQLGEVHRAYQPSVGREVALRVFGRAMVSHPQFVRRFETASQRITRVEHPHVLPLLDYWREPNRAVMVSRLMTGGSLGERIPPDGFGPAQTLEIAETIASAVASAHRHGVVHGRIRPENVLFDAEDNAFVADLGIDEICAGVITFASSAYDAPERLGGALATPASDIYSLGVLVEHLLGGSPPPMDEALDVAEGPASAVVRRATDPDPRRRQQSIEELIGELRDAFSAPGAPSATFVPTRNPYRGLEAFEQADSDDFYGRDRSVAEMVAVLQHEPLLIVVGPSGIGKSSAVKAGLLPALAGGAVEGSDSWLVTELVPGREPLQQLAAALGRVASDELPDVVGELLSESRCLSALVDELAPGNPGVLIVIDQLEELFTQTIDDTDRRAFLRLLVETAQMPDSSVRLVATLRADYFDRPLAYPGFDDAIHGRTVALGAMSPEELADAVRLPTSAVGVEVESGVVDRIVAEADLQPGALPLVQHTLSELFETRTTNTITVANLDGVGGIAGAIGRRAEMIYQSFDDRRRAAVERIFLRLVSVNEEHGDTRRRVRRTELEQARIATEDLDAVLSEYGRHRLLTFDRDPASRTPTVELAHEALLTEWQRFAGWVDEAREDLLARRRVESAAHDWINADTDTSFLYSGGRLELAEAWATGSRFELGDDERRFVAASREKADRDRMRRTRRRRLVISVLATAAVAATVMAAIALVQQRNADRQAAIALEERENAEQQTAIAEEQRGNADRQAAIAEDERENADRQAAIAEEQRQNAEQHANETRAGELAGLASLAIDEDPDRAILLGLAAQELMSEPSAVLLSALHRAAQSARLTSSIPGVVNFSMDQSPDGSLLVADRLDRHGFKVIDAASGRTVADVTTKYPISDYGLAFDSTGSTVAVAYANSPDESVPPVELFDARSGQLVGSLPGPPGDYCCTLQYDPTGRWLADLGQGYEALVWNVAAGGAPRSFGPVFGLEFLGDGASVVVGGYDANLRVFDLASGRQIRQIAIPAVDYNDLQIDPTGTLAALVSNLARRVYVIDMDTGELRKTLELRGPVFADFGPDGSVLAVSSDDGLIRLYDTDEFVERRPLVGSSGVPWFIFFAPDGSRLVSAGTGEIRTWDISAVGPDVLGNFAVPGNLIDRVVVAADESAAYTTVYTNDGFLSSVHRVDLDSGTADAVLVDVPWYFSTRPLVSPDLSIVATMAEDDPFVSELVELPGGASTRLERCDSVRAFDGTGRVAAVDAVLLCVEQGQGFGPLSRIVDLETDETLLGLGPTPIYAAAFGPPGDDGLPRAVVVIDRREFAVTVYDLDKGETVGTYGEEGDRPISLAVSGDGARLALLMDSGRLVVMDVERIMAGDDPADTIVVDIPAHAAGSKAVAFSDSGLIATGSSADGISIWSPDGKLVASVPTHQADDPSFAFVPGTDTLYYEDGGGVVRRFPVDLEEVTRIARSVLTRGFTQQECERYFAGEECPTFDV